MFPTSIGGNLLFFLIQARFYGNLGGESIVGKRVMPTLPRKRMLRAHGKQNVFARGRNESAEHVLMKAFLWALYLPQYPDLTVEIRIGDRYKPDVVQTAVTPFGEVFPIFWGEAGQIGVKKIESLARRYRETHFAIGKWETSLAPYVAIVQEATSGLKRTAPFDLIRFPADSADRFINRDGIIQVTFADVERVSLM